MTSAVPLRIATYNVHACVGRDGRHDPDRVAAVIQELNADVVALQEFSYPASVAMETCAPVVLTMSDPYECALGPTRQRSRRTVRECFGNALLTRHPLVEVHRIDLSMKRREPRGALAATIDIGGSVLHVLATHLGLRIGERRFQVQQIVDYLDSVRDTFIVVVGDFNDWLPGRSAAHVLDRRLGRPPRLATFPIPWPVLDRVWVHPAGALRRISVHASTFGAAGIGPLSRSGRHRPGPNRRADQARVGRTTFRFANRAYPLMEPLTHERVIPFMREQAVTCARSWRAAFSISTASSMSSIASLST